MANRLKLLEQRRKDLAAEGRTLQDTSPDQRAADWTARRDGLLAQLDDVNAEIEAERRLIAHEREIIAAADVVGDRVTSLHDRAGDRPFASLGDQLRAIAAAGMPGGTIDPRLYAGPSGASTVPADSGFLIQKDYSTALLERAMASAQLAPRCARIPISANSDGLEAPMVDETSRAKGSRWGGVRVYRKAEADTVTASKVKWGLFDLRLEDLMAVAYATDRLLQDTSALEAVFTLAFTEEFDFTIDDEILRGSGAGQCFGILNASAVLISVAKETGQAAATVLTENLSKMWARLWPRSRANSVWLINPDVEPQLDLLTLPAGTGALEPRFVTYGPDGILRIKGRPVLPIEQCETLGTVGDIILADLSQYVLIDKGGLQSDQSIHVRFLYNERTFRWVMRINGRPMWTSALTPYKGNNTLSPFIALATRS